MMGSDFMNQLTETPSIITSTYSLKQNNAIFDLAGRRLNSIPEKGMYIQGDKKWMRK